MYLVREIMYCKPGKVRALVEKFQAMGKLSDKCGLPKMRMSMSQGSAEDMKAMEESMTGYHDLVDHGKREIYRIEG